MSALLEASGLAFAVRGRPLVEEVSLAIAGGEFVVIVGPNGAGKSTLMRLLSGELRPGAGTVTYAGEPLAAIPAWRLACRRAVLPQASSLAFPFTVGEIARIGLDGVGRGLRAADKAAILHRALAEADMIPLAGRRYQTLSGGEQQRAQFARVLCQIEAGRTLCEAQVLFLDEPIASLDLRHQMGLLEAAASRARRGLAVVAVLHDLNLAAAFADRILVIDRGRWARTGTPAEVLTDETLREVFGVALGVGRLPADGGPFVLPDRGALRGGA